MDEIVRRAMQKWPGVPSAFGWLSLDRRGQWLIKDGRITHPLLKQFIDRNYGCDDIGRWYFQNGPQRVFVALAYAPWVVRMETDSFVTHTGRGIAALHGAWIDEEGTVVLATDLGPATVDDRDADLVSGRFVKTDGEAPVEDVLIEWVESTVAGHEREFYLPYRNRSVPVRPIRQSEVAVRFGFVPHPCATQSDVSSDASAA